MLPLGIVLKEEAIGELLSKIAAEYNYNNPSAKYSKFGMNNCMKALDENRLRFKSE
jgi:hypothetical protein